MNCRQLQESLGDHSVGLLDSQTLSDFERHVSLCAECARTVRQFRRLLELLDHAASPRPPADLWFSVRATLEVERSVRSHTRLASRAPVRWPWRSSLAATAAGFAVAAVAMMGLSAQRPDRRNLVDDWPIPSGIVAGTGVADLSPAVIPVTDQSGISPGTIAIRFTEDGAPVIMPMPLDRSPLRDGALHAYPLRSAARPVWIGAAYSRPPDADAPSSGQATDGPPAP